MQSPQIASGPTWASTMASMRSKSTSSPASSRAPSTLVVRRMRLGPYVSSPMSFRASSARHCMRVSVSMAKTSSLAGESETTYDSAGYSAELGRPDPLGFPAPIAFHRGGGRLRSEAFSLAPGDEYGAWQSRSQEQGKE